MEKRTEPKSNAVSIRHKPLAISSKKILISLIFLFGFLGFLDSVYLTVQHYAGRVPPCDVTHACEKVLTSQFATIGPVPIAAFGIGYFLIIMILTLLYLQKKQRSILQALFALSGLAFLAALGLLAIQAFILHAFCQYCLFAEAMMTLISIFTGRIFIMKGKGIE